MFNLTISAGPQKPVDKPIDEQAFLQVMYKEYCDRLRQNETLRQQGIAVVFALSGALAAVEGALLVFAAKPSAENGLPAATVPLFFFLAMIIGLFIIVLGTLGRNLAIKLSERTELHEYYSRAYRNELQKMFGQQKYQDLRRNSYGEHESKWLYRQPKKSFTYWININYSLVILGLVMTVIPLLLVVLHLLKS